jgi:hypothetical protein
MTVPSATVIGGEDEALDPAAREEQPIEGPGRPGAWGARVRRGSVAIAAALSVTLLAAGGTLLHRARLSSPATVGPDASADRQGTGTELGAGPRPPIAVLGARPEAVPTAPVTVATAAVAAAVAPATRTTRTADVAVTGTLVIDSTPASHVLLDGRPLGATPQSRKDVSAGRHDVAFVYAPGVSCHQTINVFPGGSAKVIDRLGAPSSPDRRCRTAAAAHP